MENINLDFADFRSYCTLYREQEIPVFSEDVTVTQKIDPVQVFAKIVPIQPALFIEKHQLELDIDYVTHYAVMYTHSQIDIFDRLIRNVRLSDGTIRQEKISSSWSHVPRYRVQIYASRFAARDHLMAIRIEVPHSVLTLDYRKNLTSALRQSGKEIVSAARHEIEQSSGEPGQAPKSRSGNLARDMVISVRKNSVTVTDNASNAKEDQFYALFLEAGAKASTRRGGRDKRGRKINQNWQILPRPFLSKAVDDVSQSLGERLAKSVLDSIRFQDTK